MSQPQAPEPAKLVIGLLMQRQRLIEPVAGDLGIKFGPIDAVSPWFLFDYTDYYEPEMGKSLFRRLLVFKELIHQDDLADIKVFTNSIEKKYTRSGKRSVNIDPGYLLRERFVLATGKNYTHRIYIGQKIFADLTLIYRGGAFQRLEWTYPDYGDDTLRRYLERVRKKYVIDLE